MSHAQESPPQPSTPRWERIYHRVMKGARVLLIGGGVLGVGWQLLPHGATDAGPSSSASSESATQTATSMSAGSSLCQDASGDAASQDVTSVLVRASQEELVATFLMASDRPLVGTAGWYVNVASADGSHSRQLGIKTDDGRLTAAFVFDSSTVRQENLTDNPDVQDRRVVATFPASAVSDLGAGWRWQAVTTAAGQDADACPGSVTQGRASSTSQPFTNGDARHSG